MFLERDKSKMKSMQKKSKKLQRKKMIEKILSTVPAEEESPIHLDADDYVEKIDVSASKASETVNSRKGKKQASKKAQQRQQNEEKEEKKVDEYEEEEEDDDDDDDESPEGLRSEYYDFDKLNELLNEEINILLLAAQQKEFERQEQERLELIQERNSRSFISQFVSRTFGSLPSEFIDVRTEPFDFYNESLYFDDTKQGENQQQQQHFPSNGFNGIGPGLSGGVPSPFPLYPFPTNSFLLHQQQQQEDPQPIFQSS